MNKRTVEMLKKGITLRKGLFLSVELDQEIQCFQWTIENKIVQDYNIMQCLNRCLNSELEGKELKEHIFFQFQYDIMGLSYKSVKEIERLYKELN